MKISRDNQITIADIALRLLARGICAVSMFDKRVASDVAALGDGFSFAVCAGLDDHAPSVRLITENGRFIRMSADVLKHTDAEPDTPRAQEQPNAQNKGQVGSGSLPLGGGRLPLVIRFKDVSGLIPVITGRKSVETAFAQHRMLVFGNINQAVVLVRIISIAEAYLFPKPVIKKAMRRVPKKQVPSLFIYIALLFFGVKKPSNIIEANLEGQFEAVEEEIPDHDNEIKDEVEAAK